MTQIHLTATICRERGAAGSSAQLSSGNHNLVECHNSPDNYDLHKFHTKKNGITVTSLYPNCTRNISTWQIPLSLYIQLHCKQKMISSMHSRYSEEMLFRISTHLLANDDRLLETTLCKRGIQIQLQWLPWAWLKPKPVRTQEREPSD